MRVLILAPRFSASRVTGATPRYGRGLGLSAGGHEVYSVGAFIIPLIPH
jgi:hypothetical protein